MNRYATTARPTRSILADSDRTTGGHPHISVTRVVCEASKCLVCSSSPLPIRSHAVYPFRMTTSGVDVESLETSHRVPRPFSPSRFCASDHVLMCLPDTRSKLQIARTVVYLSAFEHSKDSLLVAWIPGPPLGDLSFPWVASGVFPSLEIPKNTEECCVSIL
jgi:hypothetical protein